MGKMVINFIIAEIEIAQPMEGGLTEHIALVTFGHETSVLQHFTTNYKEVLAKIPLAPDLRDLRLAPRLLLITDGRPTYKFLTGGQDEPVTYEEDEEKEDVSGRLIAITVNIPLLKVYPVAVGNNCDMEFLTAIANSCGGKVMNLLDWSSIAKYGKKMELASKYFGLGSLSQDIMVKVLRESSGLPQEDIEFITTEVKNQMEFQNNEGTTSDEEEVKCPYQLPPVGSRVRRGPDWSRGDEDNDGPGTIISYYKGNVNAGWVTVEWDQPKKYGRRRFRYRYGAENAHDVKIQEREGPRVMAHILIMQIGCEVIRGSYRKSSNDDGIEVGTIGMVYDTNMGGKNIGKIRWQNGKRGIYGGEALRYGEIALSFRSRPFYEMMSFDQLQFVSNLHPSTSQPSIGDSSRQLPRQGDLPLSRGQLSTRELQNLNVLDNEMSDNDVTGEREALTIENVTRFGMSIVDDMNSRNQILTRKEEGRNKKTVCGTSSSFYSKTRYGQMEEITSDAQTAPYADGSYDDTKRRRIRRSNKNADV
ncbi:hypothetical protein CHS0354_021995 [Potamilus streckersoni]|uniref:Uncharacterized protein n=1 Tax=Potamilus streckersoni TaxID=2493646 RepID=A0AAE0VXB2_9BIVA|nr:hypothetical protein CHS0354_021995 [Potamilus streckersoni]